MWMYVCVYLNSSTDTFSRPLALAAAIDQTGTVFLLNERYEKHMNSYYFCVRSGSADSCSSTWSEHMGVCMLASALRRCWPSASATCLFVVAFRGLFSLLLPPFGFAHPTRQLIYAQTHTQTHMCPHMGLTLAYWCEILYMPQFISHIYDLPLALPDEQIHFCFSLASFFDGSFSATLASFYNYLKKKIKCFTLILFNLYI